MKPAARLSLTAVPGIPLVRPGDDLAALLIAALETAELRPGAGDILVVAQKMVSKAQGRYVDLATVVTSQEAQDLGRRVDKDPRLVEVILSESKRVLRTAPGVLIVEHRLGYVMANAGVDRSNVAPGAGAEPVLLLPEDPDGTAEALRAALAARFAAPIGIIINDSFGRPWRRGTVGVALGAAGLKSLHDLRGNPDLYGRVLQVSENGFADEVAAAASLVMGQGDEGFPAVLVSGFAPTAVTSPASELIRPEHEDLFR
jgi:coenzyme F420-0:L-glutamate ligase/coenzyme F420-1:gamma-L-glutamate ligase